MGHVGAKVAVVPICALALIGGVLLATNAEGAITDKTVMGTVYDQTLNPLPGASVTVEIWGGFWPDQDFFRTSSSTVTDTWGYYEVTFPSTFWDPHNTIKVTVTYDSTQDTVSVEANADQFQTVDVYLTVAIPEIGAGTSIVVAAASALMIVTYSVLRRRQ